MKQVSSTQLIACVYIYNMIFACNALQKECVLGVEH